jgi:thiol-disulfide isomerase/thioredoxin
MRATIIIILFFICEKAKSQITDSTWFESTYLPRFFVDTASYLPATSLIDKNGHKKTLADFKGKILYVGVWASSCGSSTAEFAYQEQLLKRLQDIRIDSSIQFINIHVEDSKKEWRQALKKYDPIGINLYCSDTSVLAKWNLAAPPAYLLIDPSGKVLGKDISQPDEAGMIDYILYNAVKGISPIEALLKKHQQDKLMERYKTSAAFTDEDYKKWFDITIRSFLAFQNWRNEHMKKRAF